MNGQGRRERGSGERQALPPPPPPHHFLEQNIFFQRQIAKHKFFTCEKHLRLEFIY